MVATTHLTTSSPVLVDTDTQEKKQQLAKVLSDLEAIGIEKIEAITKQGLKFAGIDENDFKAPEHAFVARLSEPNQARYLLLLVEWVRTGERKAVERFRAKHGHSSPLVGKPPNNY